MSSAGRPVPWASWQEWSQTAAWLDASDPETVQRGLDRVAAWRCRGRVPLGADIHACLVEIQLRDPCAGGQCPPPAGSPPSDDGALRLQYAMAIVRLVNGVADAAQKGRTAVSVAGLAAQAGLPRVLVDLRHEATHNELPSLPLLRLAACQALAWLRACYWQAQSDQLTASEARFRQLLQDLLASCNPGLTGSAQSFSPQPAGAAQKQQRAILAKLRVLVPSAAAALLAGPLLEAGFVRLPANGSGAPAACTADGDAADRSAATEGAATLLHGWQSLMAALQNDYPALPGLLLAGTMEQLTGGTGGAPPPAQAAAWVRLLLQHATAAASSATESGRRASSGRSREAGHPGFAWQPTQAQAAQLLATCIAAQHGAATVMPGAGDVRPAAVLLDATLVLLQHVNAQKAAATGHAKAAGFQKAVQQQARLLSSAAGTEQPAAVVEMPRWSRVEQWLPCAIGGEPSAHDPNGVSVALQQQSTAHGSGAIASTAAAAGPQEDLPAAAPDYFAQFESGPAVGAGAAKWGCQQADAVAEQLARLLPTHILVW